MAFTSIYGGVKHTARECSARTIMPARMLLWLLGRPDQPYLHLIMLVVSWHAGDSDMVANSSLMVSACLGWQQVHLLYCSQYGRPEALPGSFSKVPCAKQKRQSLEVCELQPVCNHQYVESNGCLPVAGKWQAPHLPVPSPEATVCR